MHHSLYNIWNFDHFPFGVPLCYFLTYLAYYFNMLSAHSLQCISWENAKLNPVIALEKVSLSEVGRGTARVNIVQGRG